jgi:Na+-transporting methylmalonyl-CoA/oxaloacetate decarboxylase gamma subunit
LPAYSFSLLLAGFGVVLVVLVVSAAILARVSRAERERRLDAQYETRLAERSADEESLATTTRDAHDPRPTFGEGDRR